jgi:hypothetical protein
MNGRYIEFHGGVGLRLSPVLEVEAEGREAGGVRGEALEASLHDEALDEQEREVPDNEGDEKPRDG